MNYPVECFVPFFFFIIYILILYCTVPGYSFQYNILLYPSRISDRHPDEAAAAEQMGAAAQGARNGRDALHADSTQVATRRKREK